ncbi:hypothetical protein APH_0621 [Anaplasma phagocytophilum str. HZ]|uniref:Uncharacterized protein n=1 Tax=Anaplasma phagocytophilum (strain HZ) TaxID=212042 RepID=Q2GK92_ANAPZ|nr:hypothetical protein APH_0621 [Anaplasma phagocytophilum str. HZ]
MINITAKNNKILFSVIHDASSPTRNKIHTALLYLY